MGMREKILDKVGVLIHISLGVTEESFFCNVSLLLLRILRKTDRKNLESHNRRKHVCSKAGSTLEWELGNIWVAAWLWQCPVFKNEIICQVEEPSEVGFLFGMN